MSLKILLDDQIGKLFTDNPELEEVDKNKFEISVAHFASVAYLYGIESDDLIDGIMGKGGDEGIDMCYVFCNGILVKDENVKLNPESIIKVKFFQAKREKSISVEGFHKLKEGIEEIFNLDISLSKLKVIGANKFLLEKADLIRKLFRNSQIAASYFSCEVYYVTEAPTLDIPKKITEIYEKNLKENAFSIPYKFEYWGAQKLLDLNKRHDEQLEITYESQPLSISEKDIKTSGFAGFVRGNSLMKSLIDSNDTFKSHLTEGNVRYFLNVDKKINSSIIGSAIDDEKSAIFWAMNNGITIIGDEIKPIDSSTFCVTNPQIVNGCQTIHCLYEAYSKKRKNDLPATLKIFIKLVKTANPTTQTDIISATNSQNPVKSANLKANDNIQRNIETHLKKYGVYYERRENFYKSQGFKGNKVIGLLKMAQIIHTVVNKEAILATNDTSTLFDTPAKYDSIFHTSTDFDLYGFSVKLYQIICKLKNSDIRKGNYEGEEYDLISKGGFIYLHIISSLLFSNAEIIEKNKVVPKRALIEPFKISTPVRKNEFSIRKQWLLNEIQDEREIEKYFKIAKGIFSSAASKYSGNTTKSQISLFKNRSFDRDYLRPEIDAYIGSQKKIAVLEFLA